MRSLLVIFSLLAFATPAMAKPSDWADVIEKPGDRAALPPPSKNAPQVVTKASTSKPKKERATKKAKAKKAPRRGKAKRGRH
jgi:hypothetical protein